MWQKRPRELDIQLRFEIDEMTLQMQQAVSSTPNVIGCIFKTTLQKKKNDTPIDTPNSIGKKMTLQMTFQIQ